MMILPTITIFVFFFAGNGFIEGSELDRFLYELVTSVNTSDLGPEVSTISCIPYHWCQIVSHSCICLPPWSLYVKNIEISISGASVTYTTKVRGFNCFDILCTYLERWRLIFLGFNRTYMKKNSVIHQHVLFETPIRYYRNKYGTLLKYDMY